MPDLDALLDIRSASKAFGGLQALNSVSLTVRRGELSAVIGGNGSGKSTLFNVITGFTHIDQGEIWFKGRQVQCMPAHQRTRLGMVRTFQTSRLFRSLSVIENVMVGFVGTSSGLVAEFPRLLFARRARRELASKAVAILDSVGLAGRRRAMTTELPYADLRRLEVARALATGPELMMLDEPAAGMEPDEAAGFMEVLHHLQLSGTTILLVEHNMQLVMSVAQHITVLDFGCRIAEGTPDEIANNPVVIKAYLGVMENDAEY